MSEMIITAARGTVADTVTALVQQLDSRGIQLFTTIDHAAGARVAGLELPDEVVLVFGSPAVGTALMQANPEIGLDLPLRILVWDDSGRTCVGYNDPRRLAERYGLNGQSAVLEKLAGLLSSLADSVSVA